VTACNSTLIGELVGNDGAVIAHGGGNWGDTWEAVHMCRKKLLPDLASAGVRRFIGMPQSMFYQPSTKQKKLQSDNTAIHKAHQAGMNVTLYWRQADSYEDAQSRITSANNVMTPDAAWAIGPLFPNRAPTVDVLFLLRRDKESKPGYKQIKTELEPVLADCGVTHAEIDWFDVASRPEYRPTLVAADAHEFAEMLTLTANTMLSQGRVLVTNRLHATILATLMGMPVFYADNTYGKIHATRAGSLQHPSCTSDNLRAWGFPSVVGAAQAAIKYTRLHHRTMPASETDAIDEK
jgi:pyruvyl transferase EpsO